MEVFSKFFQKEFIALVFFVYLFQESDREVVFLLTGSLPDLKEPLDSHVSEYGAAVLLELFERVPFSLKAAS